MKGKLRLLVGLSLTFCLMLLASCTQEVYEKGESDLSLLQADYVEVHVAADGKIDYVVTDEGEQLYLTQPVAKEWTMVPNTFYRALLYYNKVEGKAQVVSISQVSTILLTASSELVEGVKEDPVELESAWTDKRNRYLTLSLRLKTGKIDDGADGQHLAVCYDRMTKDADGRVTYHLRLYHDQGDVPQFYSSRYLLSVPLFVYEVDSVQLTLQTYAGPVTKKFRVSP